jgi:hypothetical protein
MSVSGISSSRSAYVNMVQDARKQSRKDLESLASALQSGDVEAAKQAFSTWQADVKSVQSARPTDQKPPLGDQVDALQGALDSGDVDAAKKAFAALLAKMQSHHRGHHHRHAAEPAPSTSSTPSAGSSVEPGQAIDLKA